MDLIDRAELLNRLYAECDYLTARKMDGAEHIIKHHAIPLAEEMPSVGWIPVTERLPEEEGEYIATTIFSDEPNISILRYESGRHFYVHDRVFGDIRVKDDEVLAWMPLPEPYREDKE